MAGRIALVLSFAGGAILTVLADGKPDFPLLCRRVLHDERSIAVMFVVFDLLADHRRSRMGWPYWQRQRRLDKFELAAPCWYAPEAFHDGEALLASIVDQGLEGVVAKKLTDPYKPGESGSGSR